MENIKLSHTLKSYSMVFLVGIFIGCICRLLDYCSLDSLWGFSSIQTLLGFWIITNTIIVLLSTSNKCAGISSFLYMFGMTLSFYGLQAILGMFIPLFSGGFRKSLFILFSLLSIPCAIAAFVLYYWNKDNVLSSLLYSLPVGALVAETIAISFYFLEHHTFLFQLLMDIIGAVVFSVLFFKKVQFTRDYTGYRSDGRITARQIFHVMFKLSLVAATVVIIKSTTRRLSSKDTSSHVSR